MIFFFVHFTTGGNYIYIYMQLDLSEAADPSNFSDFIMASNHPAKRKMLTFEEKVKVLRLNEEGDKAWSVAATVGVGPTQVYSIMKNRDLFLSEWF